MPENHLTSPVPVELRAFYPPPFTSDEMERRHNLCPVRALRVHVDRTVGSRTNNQLFVSWDPKAPGKPVSEIRLSQWIVEAIELAYSSRGLVPPVGVRAHSTILGPLQGRLDIGCLCRGELGVFVHVRTVL